MKGVILGSGITGLAAAIKTGYPIYEFKDVPGGICRSYSKLGYHFDNGGGHWIFGDQSIKNVIHSFSPVINYTRKAAVKIDTTIDYPIQKYFEEEEPVSVGSMKSWLRSKFGNQLCQLFFYPFNNKYTAELYDSIVQDDPLKSPDPREPGYNDKFSYPVAGLDDLVDNMAKKCTIHYGKKAVNINERDLTFSINSRCAINHKLRISCLLSFFNCLYKNIVHRRQHFPSSF
jgi:protoporphyrinogen oxidase